MEFHIAPVSAISILDYMVFSGVIPTDLIEHNIYIVLLLSSLGSPNCHAGTQSLFLYCPPKVFVLVAT